MPRMLWIGDDDPCNPSRPRFDFEPTWCRAGAFGTVVITARGSILYGSTVGGWADGPARPGGDIDISGVPANPLSGAIVTQGPGHPNPFMYMLAYQNAYTTSGTTLSFAGPGTLNSHWINWGIGGTHPPPAPAGDGFDVGFFGLEFTGTDPYYDDLTHYEPGYYSNPGAARIPWAGWPIPSTPHWGDVQQAKWLGGDALQPWFAAHYEVPNPPFFANRLIGYAGQTYNDGGTVGLRWQLADSIDGMDILFNTGARLTDELVWVGGNRTDETVSSDNYHPRAWLFNGGSWFNHDPPVPPTYGRVELTGLAVTGPLDAWAVGIKRFTTQGVYTTADPGQIYIAHWDGFVWTVVDTPCYDGGSRLTAVDALGPNDVWAVGTTGGLLALHWDGTRWTDVSP